MAKTRKNRARLRPKEKTILQLWSMAVGRCQMEGCNEILYEDPRTYAKMNRAYVAHINAAKEDWSRGKSRLSEEELRSIDNLMLLCDACHRMIDREKPHEYPAERLRAIKKAHIEKIRSLTSYVNLPKSQIILFGAKIGEHESPLSYSAASKALLPDYVPQDAQGIRLQIQGLVITDDEEQYWKVQDQNLVRSFTAKVASLKGRTDIEHFSVFGLGPQPLLTRLGVLIGELQKVSCYQLSREPQTWCWRERVQTMQHSLVKSKLGQGSVALRFSLSAKISSDRIERVLGPDCAILTVTHSNPNNDYLRSKEDLADFRKVTRQTLDEIKQLHGEAAVIHVFQAMPVSAAIELGRVWMPKADLPLILYDENKKNGGFHKTITITSNNQDEYYR